MSFLALSACAPESAPTTAPATTSAAPAATSPASAPAQRIASLVPAATYNLVLIGAADRLVGVSSYDNLYLPREQKNLPVIGDYQTVNYEQLAGLRPTAIIIQMAETRIPPVLRQLSDSGRIELVNMTFNHIEDIWSSVRELGRVADRTEAAEQAIAAAQNDLKDLTALNAHRPRPKVLYLVSPKLMLICGGKNFIDEMITAAGAENVGATAGDGFIEQGRETIVKLAPEVLLIGALDEPAAQQNDPRLKPWLDLPVPAAASKRVYLVTDGNSLTPSVNIGKNVRALADLIHHDDPLAPPATGRAATGGEARP